MNRREAKRQVCREAATILLDLMYGRGDPKVDAAVVELVSELERRGGMKPIPVLPGQRSLLDELEEAIHGTADLPELCG